MIMLPDLGRVFQGGGGGFSGESGEETEEIIRQPKMLLEECSLMDRGLEAGAQETMRVSFRNRSASQTMYNLKVVLQTESKDIRMGRNSFYFSEIAPGDTIELENELSVTPLAEEGSASINFQFEYEDKKGNGGKRNRKYDGADRTACAGGIGNRAAAIVCICF